LLDLKGAPFSAQHKNSRDLKGLSSTDELFFTWKVLKYMNLSSGMLNTSTCARPSAEVLSTRCPECAAVILDSTAGLFRKPGLELWGEAGLFLGDGLALMEDVTPAGEAMHKAVRAVAAPAFGPRAMTRLAREFVRGGVVQLDPVLTPC